MLISYMRTGILYLVLILSIRLMGKRQIGQMEASEFVVTMLVANLASIPMQDGAIPLYSGLLPILTVLGLELVLSGLIMRSIPMRRLFCGKPVILIENGHILQENLRKTRVTLDELVGHLRQKDVLDLHQVQFAILETNGNLSVFPYSRFQPPCAADAGVEPAPHTLPITVIEDGYVSEANLRIAGKDRVWLARQLEKEKLDAKSVFLLTVDADGNTVLVRKEEGQ